MYRCIALSNVGCPDSLGWFAGTNYQPSVNCVQRVWAFDMNRLRGIHVSCSVRYCVFFVKGERENVETQMHRGHDLNRAVPHLTAANIVRYATSECMYVCKYPRVGYLLRSQEGVVACSGLI